MRNIFIIIKKQFKDTLKNKTILIQFILFPFFTIIMENLIHIEGMPKYYFARMFSVMYLGMSPTMAVAAIISEEKEKNTLRALMMANVKPWQYLTGICSYVWIICMIGACLITTVIEPGVIPFYMCLMALGFFVSTIVGACVGICSKNQMTATSMVMPIIIVLAFAPMLSMFNEKISVVAQFVYTQQLMNAFGAMSWGAIGGKGFAIIGVNTLLFIVLFVVAYRKKGLE